MQLQPRTPHWYHQPRNRTSHYLTVIAVAIGRHRPRQGLRHVSMHVLMAVITSRGIFVVLLAGGICGGTFAMAISLPTEWHELPNEAIALVVAFGRPKETLKLAVTFRKFTYLHNVGKHFWNEQAEALLEYLLGGVPLPWESGLYQVVDEWRKVCRRSRGADGSSSAARVPGDTSVDAHHAGNTGRDSTNAPGASGSVDAHHRYHTCSDVL